MNLIVAFIAYGIYFACIVNGFYNEIFINLMSPIITLNVCLAVFNVIPIPPLDGFQILAALCIKRGSKVVQVLYRYGFIILLVLVFTGVVSNIMSFVSGPIIYGFDSFYMLFVR